MTEIKNALLAGLAFGILLGIFLGFLLDLKSAMIAGSISGLAFGAILYFFVSSKMVKRQTQIDGAGNLTLIHSGGANHFKNGEAVGGKLYLLPDRLQFKSHSFNIQNHEHTIELTKIREVSFYNTLGLVPNGLAIITTDGHAEKFVVNGRKLWKEEIERLVNRT